MNPRLIEKAYAIRLRKAGLSYSEILKKVPVSKSSISGWLRELPLTEDEKATLKHRRDSNISVGRMRAAAALRGRRLDREGKLYIEAKEQYSQFHSDPFFHVGIALYWAEGSKRDATFTFTNSDPDMIILMLDWMEKYLGAKRGAITVRLHIHKPYAHENLEKYWSDLIGIPAENFKKTLYKPTSSLVKKRPDYKGCLRIQIFSVACLRKYQFWQKLLLEDYRKQS